MIPRVAAFGRFWYGFIVGDDWTVAVAVGLGLLATWLLARHDANAWWLVPVVVVVSVPVSVLRKPPEKRMQRAAPASGASRDAITPSARGAADPSSARPTG